MSAWKESSIQASGTGSGSQALPKPILNIPKPGPGFLFLDRGDCSFIDVRRHSKRTVNLDPAIAEDPAVGHAASFPVFCQSVDVGALSSLFVADRSSLFGLIDDRDPKAGDVDPLELAPSVFRRLVGQDPEGKTSRRAPYRLVTVWELTGSHPPPRNRKRVNWRETVPGGPQETLPESPS